jgi:diacylglycerol kinase family enzyme
VLRAAPDVGRRHPWVVRADGWVVHRGPIELVVVGTTPFYGRGLQVNPGARPDAGVARLRVYPGPVHRFLLEAGRWVLHLSPRARPVDASSIEIHSLDDRGLPLQADGDALGERQRWSFTIRPQAVRLIGRWD